MITKWKGSDINIKTLQTVQIIASFEQIKSYACISFRLYHPFKLGKVGLDFGLVLWLTSSTILTRLS